MFQVNQFGKSCVRAIVITIMFASLTLADEGDSFTTLSELESAAFFYNPTLRAGQARVEASRQRAQQAGLKTNPTFGIYGEEIGNNENSIFGAYVSRTIRRGDKRFYDQEVQSRNAQLAEQLLEQQKIRVRTDVRTAFYKVLIAQRQLKLSKQLNDAQQRSAAQTKKMYDSDESTKTDWFQAQIKAQQTAIGLRRTELNHISAWRELVAVVGMPQLEIRFVSGSLDDLPEPFEWNTTLERILSSSPEVHTAQAAVNQAQAVYRQAIAGSVPNLSTQFNAGHDTATNDTFGGFQIGMPIQINNRNRGNIAAALAEICGAQHELRRVQLSIQKRLATEFRDYQQAREQTNVYANDMLPKAKQTLDLATAGFPEGETSFLQLLSAQQTTIDLTSQYLQSLQQLWNSHQRIAGWLLNDSLEPLANN